MHISPVNLSILAYTLEVEGFDPSQALARCGMTAADLEGDEGEWIDVAVYEKLVHAAVHVTADPAFGLVAGKSLALTKYSALTPLAIFTASLRHLLADLERFAPLVMDVVEIKLDDREDGVSLRIDPMLREGIGGQFRTEMVVTSGVQMLRFAGAGADDVHSIDLPFDVPPSLRERYDTSLGARLNVGCGQCAIHFNRALLDRPLPMHDALAYVAARTRAESMLAARRARVGMVERTRQWLLAAFPRQPSVGDAAEHLGLSERSFRRCLAAEGATFVALAQGTQQLMADRLLADQDMPLKRVADQLGFTSVSSFHRAFKRWTGLTPVAWRERGHAAGASVSAP